MKNWIKPLIEILIVVFLFALISELFLRSTIGDRTECRGEFRDGLYIEGEIEYKLDDIEINGEDWVANFSDLSEVRIEFRVGNKSYNYTVQTSRLTIVPNGSGSIEFYRIVNNSKINTITFHDGLSWVVITLPQNQIVGIIGNTSYTDELELSNVIFKTDNETINAGLGRGNFYLLGETKEIPFNISMSENYHITTYTQNGDTISLKGDLKGYNFQGSIWSNGKLITHGNPKLVGDMELIILQNTETYSYTDSWEYYWELEIEGEYEVDGGGGYPFWSFGLMLSAIPSIIIILYHIHKKNIDEREGLR